MPLVASGIQLPDDLSQVLGSQYGGPQGAIKSTYSRLNARAAGNNPNGTGIGDYAKSRLGTQQGFDEQNLSNTLYGQLGNSGYDKAISDRDFNQQMELARRTGEAMKPTELEQVIAGIGGGANAGASGMEIYNSLKRPSSRLASARPSMSDSTMGYPEEDIFNG